MEQDYITTDLAGLDGLGVTDVHIIFHNRLAKDAGCVTAPSSSGEVYNGEDALLRPLNEKGGMQ